LADLLRQLRPVGKTEALKALSEMQAERPYNNIINLAYNHWWLTGG
jgi:hypothetical protein